MAEKEGKNINTALKGVLASDSTLIGLVDGNVRQIETDVDGGLMSFDKGVSKSDINVENGVTGFNPVGQVAEGDKRAVSGEEVYEATRGNLKSFHTNSKKHLKKVVSIQGVEFFENGELSTNPNVNVSALIPITVGASVSISCDTPFLKRIRVYKDAKFSKDSFLGLVDENQDLVSQFNFDLNKFETNGYVLYISIITKSLGVINEDISSKLNVLESLGVYANTDKGNVLLNNLVEYKLNQSIEFTSGQGFDWNNGSIVANQFVQSAIIDLSDCLKVDFQMLRTGSIMGVALFNDNMNFIKGYATTDQRPIYGNYGDRLTINVEGDIRYLGFTYATDAYARDNSFPLFDSVNLHKYKSEIVEDKEDKGSNEQSLKELYISNSDRFRVNTSVNFNSINSTLAEKYTLFENAVNKLGHDVVKTEIGNSVDDEFPIYGYSVTPKNGYDYTVALTAHVHGDERISPMGIIESMELIKNRADEFNLTLANRTRFLIVFVVNPYGYVNNQRYNKNNVNLNRNNDYRWALNTNDEAQYKGTSPNSEPETKAVIGFFNQYKGKIDYHLDAHDMLAPSAYAPANNKLFKYTNEMNAMREALEQINCVRPSQQVPYINEMGSFGNYFNEILGCPSITLESSGYFWDNLGVSLEMKVAKGTELVMAYLHMFFYLNPMQYRHNMYYYKNTITCFQTEEYGISTWDFVKLKSAFLKNTTVEHISGKDVFKIENGTKALNFLVITGLKNDNLNSDLVGLRVSEELNTSGYSSNLKSKANVYILPDATSLISTTTINAVITAKNITHIIFVNCVSNSDTNLKNNDIKYVLNAPKYIKDNYIKNSNGLVGLENTYSDKMYSVYLNNQVNENSRYGFAVVNWVSSVINIMNAVSFDKR